VATPGETARIGAVLEQSRRATETRIASLARLLAGITDSADTANIDDEHDPEGATIAFERAQVVALLELAQRDLAAVDAAAGRLARGTYGSCRRCGRRIAPARLRALPSTEVCIDCAGG
jgi:RNA polymerase-binding transcription factor DksA